jgi:3-methylcrotonyl-CoA carboxylase alpha subunit
MFRKILIANRGEIACRVIDTCRRLGVATVAVYSDADAAARHVAMADEAVHIGGAQPSESYLRADAIIAAALGTGAQAIHPGYGFLSENPGFVEAVEAAGLVFIGPSAEAIRAMGLKDAAKALMEKAGVPVVPGYHGADQEPGRLEVEAADIGYPVLIKAVAGGGGKGMRLVETPEAFINALESARAEARGAFGNDAVLIEKYVEKPRHIEVQVFGDGHQAVHLFERDCSLQRRHQKVIEEAPAPGMTAEMRHAMGAAAVRAAEAIGYSGAGTIEFIVDASAGLRADRFWFMEMNTRLQVEHPVTEAVTGIDLVEWQLRVAAGESLPRQQDELELNGHSFEARLYAEDVAKGFLPATGRLTHLRFANGARAETGVRPGDTISPYYDPMIAKIIVHGPTRDLALSKLRAALSETQVAGTVTNLTFLGKLAADPDFSAGDVDTGLIGRKIAAFQAVEQPPDRISALAALTAADPVADGFALWQKLDRRIDLVGADPFAATLRVTGPGQATVMLGDDSFAFRRDPDGWTDGQPGRALKIGDSVSVFANETWSFTIPDPLSVGSAATAGNVIEAPMPGLVKAVLAEPGQMVSAGDRLAVLEAMKMEHTLTAPRDGKVAEVLAKAGAQVEAGAALIRLEDDE